MRVKSVLNKTTYYFLWVLNALFRAGLCYSLGRTRRDTLLRAQAFVRRQGFIHATYDRILTVDADLNEIGAIDLNVSQIEFWQGSYWRKQGMHILRIMFRSFVHLEPRILQGYFKQD